MPTRSHLTRPRPRQAVIHLGDGDDVTVTYDANRLTTNWLSEGLARDETNDPTSLAKALSGVMLGWNVTEDDGSEFPPTVENIASLSIPQQTTLMQRLLEVALPARAEGEVSSASSSTPSTSLASTQENPQNGHDASLSQKPSGALPSR